MKRLLTLAMLLLGTALACKPAVTPVPAKYTDIDEHAGRNVPVDPVTLLYAMYGLRPDAPPQGDTTVEDVLVVFSTKVWSEIGGTEALAKQKIQPGVDQWNTAKANQASAGTLTSMNLLGVLPVPFTEGIGTNGGSCLNWMADSSTDPANGGYKIVMPERERIGADLVACVSHTDACGLGYLFVTANGYPFSSTEWNGCTIANLSFIHEIGHNHGGNHEPQSACNAPTCGGSNYGYGWGGPTSGQSKERDPLTYPREGGSRVLFWSTPLMTRLIAGVSYVIGTAQFNDNLKQLVSYGPTIAGFRARIANPIPAPAAAGKPTVH